MTAKVACIAAGLVTLGCVDLSHPPGGSVCFDASCPADAPEPPGPGTGGAEGGSGGSDLGAGGGSGNGGSGGSGVGGGNGGSGGGGSGVGGGGVGIGGNGGCAGTRSTLIGHWRLDDGSGTIAKDASCAGNDATLMGFTNPPAWAATGKRGGALAFNGGSTWLRVPDSTSLDSITTGLTVAAWVYRESAQAGKYGAIVSRQDGATSDDNFAVFIDPNDKLALWLRNASCTETITSPIKQWIHIAATFDGTFGRMYRGGVLVCMMPVSSPPGADTTPLMIGADSDSPAGTPMHFLPAVLDEVLLYNRALAGVEISNLAADGTPPN